jgi:UPF0755 protein
MRKRLWIAVAVGAGTLLGAAAALGYAWRTLNEPLAIPAEGTRLTNASGTTLRGVSRELAERGLLTQPWLLTAYGRISGDATRIRAGEYQIAPDTSALGLLATIVSGQVYLHQITIVEGWKFEELLTAVRAHPAIEPTALDGAAIMASLGAPGVHPEGQFFPDTYRFPRGTSDVDLLRTAHAALNERLAAAWERRTPGTKLENAYQALILASIIEKETALPAERPLISGVFHERLRRGMRLQTDPTVIYGLGAAFDGNLRRDDLERDTPYNTYTRRGLPPTPIALAGGGSIEAAVAPEESDAVYFVATGRPDGSHYFSATLEEHERAVREYLRELRATDR